MSHFHVADFARPTPIGHERLPQPQPLQSGFSSDDYDYKLFDTPAHGRTPSWVEKLRDVPSYPWEKSE